MHDADVYSSCDIAPRDPDSCVISEIVRGHLAEFLKRVRDDTHGQTIPDFVQRELRALSRCSDFTQGFLAPDVTRAETIAFFQIAVNHVCVPPAQPGECPTPPRGWWTATIDVTIIGIMIIWTSLMKSDPGNPSQLAATVDVAADTHPVPGDRAMLAPIPRAIASRIFSHSRPSTNRSRGASTRLGITLRKCMDVPLVPIPQDCSVGSKYWPQGRHSRRHA
ncbi:MAG: hypothetical protein ACI9OJ_005602 [Myxococcota bacterium]|jgi:hypothetical protein